MTKRASVDTIVPPARDCSASTVGVGEWVLSPSVTLRHTSTYCFRRRTSGVPPESSRLVLSLQTAGTAVVSSGTGPRRVLHADEIVLMDESLPNDFRFLGEGASIAVRVDPSALGLPPDILRSAIGRLNGSGIRTLMSNYLVGMLQDADNLTLPEMRVTIAQTTLALVKTLIVSAVRPARTDHELLAPQALTPAAGVKAYMLAHLADVDLCPVSIARARNVSLRQLYNIWADEPDTVMQWLIKERLAAARRLLGTTDRGVSAIARDCGFADLTHFGRRFRAESGMSPTAWRAQRAAAAGY